MRIRRSHKVLTGLLLLALVAITVALVKTTANVKQLENNVDRQIQDIRLQKDSKIQKDGETIKEKDSTIQNLNGQLQSKAQKAADAAKIAQAAPKPTAAPVAAYVAPQAASGDNYALVTKWANHYHVDATWLHRVVKCESGYRSDAINGKYWAQGSTPTGIGQFLKTTYIANAARIGLPAQDDRLNPDRSMQVMAWMFSIGQWVQWECR